MWNAAQMKYVPGKLRYIARGARSRDTVHKLGIYRYRQYRRRSKSPTKIYRKIYYRSISLPAFRVRYVCSSDQLGPNFYSLNYKIDTNLDRRTHRQLIVAIARSCESKYMCTLSVDYRTKTYKKFKTTYGRLSRKEPTWRLKKMFSLHSYNVYLL